MLNNRFFQTQLNLKKIGVRVNIKARRTLRTFILKESVCDPTIYDVIFITFSLYIFVFYFTSTWKTQHNNINRKVSPVIFQRIFHHSINNVWYNIQANKPITVTTLSNKLVILLLWLSYFYQFLYLAFIWLKIKGTYMYMIFIFLNGHMLPNHSRFKTWTLSRS